MARFAPGVIFAVLGLGMLWQMPAAPQANTGAGDPGPWIFPTVLALLMIVLGLVDVLRVTRKAETGADASETPQAEPDSDLVDYLVPPPRWAQLGIVVLLIAYVAVFERLGYTVATMLFLAGTVFLLSRRRMRDMAVAGAVAVVATLAFGFLLYRLVGVPLPGAL